LRNYVAAMDSDKAEDWRAVLALVDTEMGKDFSKVEFSDMTGVAAVVGYLPEEFAVSLSGKPVSAEKAAAAAAAAKAKKKPWWKFW
jgi:hypothetical protein